MDRKKKILFVEDQEIWRETIQDALSEFDIRCVENTEEFWRLLNEFIPDLFLIDWLLLDWGGLTAESLIRRLLTEHYKIPRVVLTSGMGDEGTAALIAELQCDYVEKGSGIEAIKEKIWECIVRAASSTDLLAEPKPEQVERTASELETTQPEVDQKKFERRKEYYERNINELEKRKKEVLQEKENLDQQRNQLKERKEELEQQNDALQQQKETLERDKQFFKRFMNTTKSIVDADLELRDFAGDLLQLLVEYCDCHAGAILFFNNSEGILVDRLTHGKVEGQNTEEVVRYTMRKIGISEIGRTNQIKSLVQKTIGGGTKAAESLDQTLLMESFQNERIFNNVRLEEVLNRKHLLLVPLQMNGTALGAILLFDKLDGHCFSKIDKTRINQLPLSDMYSGAADMPFRTYKDKPGVFMSILIRIFRERRTKPWKLIQWLMSSFMELIKLGVVIIAVLIILWPLYIVFTSDMRSVHMEVLRAIELLIMLFTSLLFSLGLLVLFEPNYARSLPKWMLSFTRISTLERTILRLVVIILAIDLLGRFLNRVDLTNEKAAKYSALELLIMSGGVSLMILAAGVFSRYFLYEKEETDDDI